MKTPFSLFASVTIAITLLITSCERHFDNVTPITGSSTGTTPPAPTPTGPGDFKIIAFDPMLMKSRMDTYLNTQNLSGYAYTIYVNGKRVAAADGNSGWARKAVDGPALAHDTDIRQELASCSKYLSMLAMVKMLERANLSLDTPIWPFLPTYMTPTANVKNISFRQLLSHYTGLVGGINDINITLAEMQQSVETTIPISQYNQYQYNNMNFALVRLLLPYVYWEQVQKLGLAQIKQKEASIPNLDTELANVFLSFVRSDVFKPAGLSNWNQLGASDPGAGSPAMYYSSAVTNMPGVTIGSSNDIRVLGSVGFDLNAIELAQIVAAAHANKIVSETAMEAIKTGYKGVPLGFNNSATGKYGEYYYKYGDINITNGFSGGMASMLVDFDCPSANVQIVVLANTNNTNVSNINWIRFAFDNAWQ